MYLGRVGRYVVVRGKERYLVRCLSRTDHFMYPCLPRDTSEMAIRTSKYQVVLILLGHEPPKGAIDLQEFCVSIISGQKVCGK